MIKTNFLGNKVFLVDKEREVNTKPYDFINYKNCRNNEKKECPFCILSFKESSNIIFKDKEDWDVSVVPNKYPFIEDSYVIVHKNHLDDFVNEEYAFSFGSAVDFLYKLSIEKKKHLVVFKNNGFLAGASLEHSHEQAIFFDHKDYPLQDNKKVIYEINNSLNDDKLKINEFWISPSIPLKGYETWVIFESNDLLKVREWDRLTIAFKTLKKIFGNFDYNLILYHSVKKEFPVFAQIIPRFSPMASLEISFGIKVNPIIPEKAVKKIKSKLEV